jgi:hypothetical protein|tara:strand:+ start:213 stop:917 length:705 start_codon:yes stop_codon:yes gene_type:complete
MSDNEPPVDHTNAKGDNLFDMTEEQIDRFYKDIETSVDEPSPPTDPSTGLPYNPQYFFKCTEQTASGTKRNSISHECETLHEILEVFEQFLQGSGFSWVEPGSIQWVQEEDDEDSNDDLTNHSRFLYGASPEWEHDNVWNKSSPLDMPIALDEYRERYELRPNETFGVPVEREMVSPNQTQFNFDAQPEIPEHIENIPEWQSELDRLNALDDALFNEVKKDDSDDSEPEWSPQP